MWKTELCPRECVARWGKSVVVSRPCDGSEMPSRDGEHSSSRFKLKVMAGFAKSPPFGRLDQSASPFLHVTDSNSALNLDFILPWRESSVGSPFSRQNSETLHEPSAEM